MSVALAIGFDFDHTLGVDNGLERRAMFAFASELGRPLDPHDPEWQGRVDLLLADFRSGAVDLDGTIARFAALLGVARADPNSWRAQCYALVDAMVEPIEGARETIAELRARGVPLAILTNGWSPLQEMKIARALGPDTIARVLVSDRLRAVKPERAAFDALVDALGAPRERVWYVGDNARGDIGGALAAGLQAVWFDWEGQVYPHDLPPPTAVIHRLRELAERVQNILAP